jgi:hypothetical protein
LGPSSGAAGPIEPNRAAQAYPKVIATEPAFVGCVLHHDEVTALVVCAGNGGYAASLEPRTIYIALRDADAAKHGLLFDRGHSRPAAPSRATKVMQRLSERWVALP